jgi:hypothetical protein
MMKKMTAILLAIGLVFGMASSAFATAGWQTVGSYYVTNGNSSMPNVFVTSYHDAPDMGNFGVYISDHRVLYNADPGFNNWMRIDLWEDDGATGDDFIGSAYYYPGTMGAKLFTFSVNGYGDGIGLNPELYVRTTASYGYSNFYLTLMD